MMTRSFGPVAILLALAACTPPGGPAPTGGVGFGDYEAYRQQQERLARTRTLETPWNRPQAVAPAAALPPPAPAPVSEPQAIAAEALAAIGAGPVISPAARTPAVEVPALPTPPGSLPPPPVLTGDSRANIAAYALATTHNPGTPMYRRSNPFRNAQGDRACGRFASPGLAQEEFLRRGGPERDPLNLDPDGDGFVCGWNPAPFRIRN